jgi:hypothetical protein
VWVSSCPARANTAQLEARAAGGVLSARREHRYSLPTLRIALLLPSGESSHDDLPSGVRMPGETAAPE